MCTMVAGSFHGFNKSNLMNQYVFQKRGWLVHEGEVLVWSFELGT